jgi:putative nucleotidyltransferase with HDIG domain
MTCTTDTLPRWLQAQETALPMLPAAAVRVIDLASQPNVTVSALTEAVSRDPVLASRLLGAANSGLFSGYGSATTVMDAAMRLGVKGVRSVVVTVSFASRMHDPKVYGSQGGELLEHAVGTACVARMLAAGANADADACFIAGLLHDIGKLVVLKLAHDARRKSGLTLSSDEVAAAVATHHAEVGATALARWKLPEALIEAVACHHDYTRAQLRPADAAVVYAANHLAHRYGFGCAADERDILNDPVAAFIRLGPSEQTKLDETARAQFETARATFK